jgi:hypothetical protein
MVQAHQSIVDWTAARTHRPLSYNLGQSEGGWPSLGTEPAPVCGSTKGAASEEPLAELVRENGMREPTC